VINNVDDGLLISLSVTCDQQHSAVGPVIHVVLRPSRDTASQAWPRPVGRPVRQLEIRANPKYLFPFSVPY